MGRINILSFGYFLQKVWITLWNEYEYTHIENFLIYNAGAPELTNYILELYNEGQSPEFTAKLINNRILNIE